MRNATLNQFSGLLTREIMKTYRNPWIIAITVVQPFMWLAFFGSSFASAPKSFLEGFFHTSSYIAFLLPGVLSTSMLTVGMFGSMSTIQDKRFGYMKRILLTPTDKATIFVAKSMGSTTRGMVQLPVMVIAAFLFGVSFPLNPILWIGWILALFFLGLGFSSLFMAMTVSSTDWQTPGVISNFITMPLMFSSTALFPQANFPAWMRAISSVNPVTFSATLGRSIVLGGAVDWTPLGYLAIFAVLMLFVGSVMATKWLRVE
ncbi:MAG: ABC transporter permease [Thermoplasmata archaeon]|nr:ABC transporter permease [Candidatus Sysuiplasma acidicola]MBX8645956.1 ABC transporter permease [Candidatus Sysuiplasma acidicola]MDH2906006.1 ABC transporter permease [Methanomassiliicoccales archaeon]